MDFRNCVLSMKTVHARLLLGLVLAGAAGIDAIAQQTTREGVPVVVANRTIIVLRGPIAGYTARERAAATMERIEQALAGEKFPGVSIANTPEGRGGCQTSRARDR